MRLYLVFIVSLLCLSGLVWANDAPEIISRLGGAPPDTFDFGMDFCWIGDVNKDGYDDILVNHPPINKVYIFYGGAPMENRPVFTFPQVDTSSRVKGFQVNYIGNLTTEESQWIAILSYRSIPSWYGSRVDLYRIDNGFDTIPDISFQRGVGHTYSIGKGVNKRPSDFNGDGYNDLLLIGQLSDTTRTQLHIFFGGEDFDTIPDWTATIESDGRYIGGEYFCTGGDLNGDGYNDFIISVLYFAQYDEGFYQALRFYVFLGGEVMDTIPALTYVPRDFFPDSSYWENFYMNRPDAFSIIPDVNGDGYDEWMHMGTYLDGYGGTYDMKYLIFGQQELSIDNRMFLQGLRGRGDDGWISGGDINGDGYGDVIVAQPNGLWGDGLLSIHLGSRWMTPEWDIAVVQRNAYGMHGYGSLVGAIGDYNGDGIKDFVLHKQGRDHGIMFALYIMGGNSNWQTSIEDADSPHTYELQVSVHPNPFNASVRIDYSIPLSGHYRLSVYDVNGRLVEALFTGEVQSGNFSQSWTAPSAGIYFVALSNGTGVANVNKVVCLK